MEKEYEEKGKMSYVYEEGYEQGFNDGYDAALFFSITNPEAIERKKKGLYKDQLA